MAERPGGTPTAKRLALVLLDELQEITDKRLNSVVHEFRQQALDNWKIYNANYRNWLQRVNAEIHKLRETESADEADWLAEQVWDSRDTHNPAQFNVVILPENGRRETWRIIGESDPLPLEDTSDEPQGANFAEAQWESNGGQPGHQNGNASICMPSATEAVLLSINTDASFEATGCADQQLRNDVETAHANIWQSIPVLSRIQSTSVPIAVELDTFRRGAINLSQAVAQKLWISHDQSQKAFCLTCPCPPMIAPTGAAPGDISEGTHHLIPRFFHFHPFINNDALRHFREVHNEAFLDIGEMLRKYGSELQTGDIRLDTWAIAGHNMSIQLWQERISAELREAESKMLQQCKHPLMVPLDPRSIKKSKVPENSFIFGSGSQQEWIVYCPISTCSEPHFESHPFKDDTAIRHFQSHGLHLSKSHLLHLFGLRVIPDQKSVSASEGRRDRGSVTHLRGVSTATQDADQSISGEAGLATTHSQRSHHRKLERIVERRDQGRAYGGKFIQYRVHFVGSPDSEWVNIKKLGEFQDMVESFDRQNGKTTPWPVKQERQRR